ncbi:hypothetical protein HBI81_199000 [Parastagonospora nodorum]|nr:hypothetical protein HBI09_063420 [Parastagonospora nodorum]KAH4809915.1 hypothetical protein HBH61_108870 [Parastagonospora nodorum]KAH4999540.1 hypothetical protein HBI77_171210 [Parastagonospora nodorum]KAH5252012.1 hypothetical protein HBI72_145290 [Parastagonospora nodorum]KAH5330725.1 hypothetical protein HBI50_070720 [Parastagonospora nodorum]
MKSINYLFATIACLADLVPLGKAANLSISHDSAAQDATAFAIQYAYPISQWQQAVTNILDAVKRPNALWPYRTLSGPLNRTIVGPNADTLYIWVAIDLSHEDLVLTIPNISDGRNWIWPFYDIYGNNFAGMSINEDSPPGDYLIRRADDALVQPGIEYTTPDQLSAYKGVVSYATTYGIMLGRILVRQNTTEDIATIRDYQDQTILKTIPRNLSQPYAAQAPRLSRELIDTSNATNRVTGYLNLLAKIGQFNQPDVLSDRYRVASKLGLAGIADGIYTPPRTVNLTAATIAANASIAAAYSQNLIDVGNNWVIPKVKCQGIFGVEYGCRAYRALRGYLGLVQSENLFITNKSDNLTLGATEAFLFTFSGKPPIKSTGFWSLTVYGADQYLVPNELGRYVVGDRSTQLKFEDGGLVYGDGANGTEDGRFQVLLQPADVPPPENWTSNWLPAPAGGGKLLYSVRFYSPAEAFTNGEYVFPTVETIDAIKG